MKQYQSQLWRELMNVRNGSTRHVIFHHPVNTGPCTSTGGRMEYIFASGSDLRPIVFRII